MIADNRDEKVDLENTHTLPESPQVVIHLKQFCKVHVVLHNLLYL